MRSTTSRRPSLRVCALASVVSVAALLSACGSDSDSASESTAGTASTEEATTDSTADTTAPVTDDTTDGTTVDAGSASGPATREDFVKAFAINYALFDDDEKDQCIGETFVTAIGEDQLSSSGVAPGDVSGIVLLSEIGLTVDAETLPATIEDMSACGDLVAVSLASATANDEQTACASEIITNELAAEQLLVQVTELEPSAELLAARDALIGCTTTTTGG